MLLAEARQIGFAIVSNDIVEQNADQSRIEPLQPRLVISLSCPGEPGARPR